MNEARPTARLPRGLEDRTADLVEATRDMTQKLGHVYAKYGFMALETPVLEYADGLGKFLPDQDRPNEGVFALRDDDEQWISLRYDLTAPLARHVAEHFDRLPKPYRTYRYGDVFRNEKPGPGRFRQFMQFDADTVGTASPLADAEMCLMVAEGLRALGLRDDQFVVKIFNRKIVDGFLDSLHLNNDTDRGKRLTVLRALDKRDRLGDAGVALLLGEGRLDESGDFTKGAGLSANAIESVLAFARSTKASTSWQESLEALSRVVGESEKGQEGVEELQHMAKAFTAMQAPKSTFAFDATVVRGLEYYTGSVFEVELTMPILVDGKPQRFGAVGGGGRYDGLVSRFRGENVPATGISIGVSRLLSALKAANLLPQGNPIGPVVVMVMDKEFASESLAMAAELRAAGITAEPYVGTAGMKAQLKYADRRHSPCAIMVGSDERAAGIVTLKDLFAGKEQAANITDNAEWRAAKVGQQQVPRAQLVSAVKSLVERYRSPA